MTASDIQSKTLTLSWNISDPSPGNTSYTVSVYESTDEDGKAFKLSQTLRVYGKY